MQFREFDLSADCIGATFESGLLKLACKRSDTSLALIIVNPQDTDYLPAMTWAITNKLIG
jgi:hypothetical protein